MRDINGAGYDPSVEDVPNTFEESAKKCGERLYNAILNYKVNKYIDEKSNTNLNDNIL